MRRTFTTAAALCACTGAAQAQSGVTMYGVIDVPIEYASQLVTPSGGASGAVRMASGGGMAGSRWGLRGVEDLGGGNQALFVLENGFAADAGGLQQGGRLFGRQAFVGLGNASYGKLTMGRQYSAIFDVLANFSPTRYAPQWEPITLLLGLNSRSDNSVKYSGAFGPLTATAYWSFGNAAVGSGEVPGQFRRDTGYGAGATYLSGPFGLGLAFDQFAPSLNGNGGATGTIRKLAVAASYAPSDVLKFMAGYRWGQAQAPAGLATATTQNRDDYYWFGINYQATSALSLILGYSYDNLKSMAVSATSTTNPANPWQVQLVADYNLSARTDVYLMGAYARNAGLALDTAMTSYATGHQLAPGKDGMVGIAAGIRHKF